jgi:hypothetical protein
MGGCANSKYAVDESSSSEKTAEKKSSGSKKPFLKKSSNKNGNVKNKADEVAVVNGTSATALEHDAKQTNGDAHVELANGEAKAAAATEDNIEFIDKEDVKAAAAAAAAAAGQSNEDDAKKEVTTYQTTVVKHSQKEGDELLQHLKDEAFRTLQNTLKQLTSSSTKTTTASLNGSSPQTATSDADSSSSSAAAAEDLVQQVKSQVVQTVGKAKQAQVEAIIDSGVALIRDNKCKSMNELESELEKVYATSSSSADDNELVKKVINATTGFLTAKGTEAGALLSNILANVTTGLQGVMNETEKTTVKVTRTITEQVLSGGQLKEITRVITSDQPVSPTSSSTQGATASSSSSPPSNISDILRSLTSNPEKIIKTGTTVTSTSSVVNEQHEHLSKDEVYTTTASAADSSSQSDELKEKAEKVVNKAVNAAVEQIQQQSGEETSTTAHQNGETTAITNGYHTNSYDLNEHLTEENIKIEEESTVRTSTTKIILNGSGAEAAAVAATDLDQVQSEFFKNGKREAEISIKKLNATSDHDDQD